MDRLHVMKWKTVVFNKYNYRSAKSLDMFVRVNETDNVGLKYTVLYTHKKILAWTIFYYLA